MRNAGEIITCQIILTLFFFYKKNHFSLTKSRPADKDFVRSTELFCDANLNQAFNVRSSW